MLVVVVPNEATRNIYDRFIDLFLSFSKLLSHSQYSYYDEYVSCKDVNALEKIWMRMKQCQRQLEIVAAQRGERRPSEWDSAVSGFSVNKVRVSTMQCQSSP